MKAVAMRERESIPLTGGQRHRPDWPGSDGVLAGGAHDGDLNAFG